MLHKVAIPFLFIELTCEYAWHIRYGMFGSIANDATITLLLMVFMLAGRDP
eukprot:COSAG02_NODE_31463_length_533_cov_0.829493_1_plen_50_part_10